jgi:SAM-dependent methyltransferase
VQLHGARARPVGDLLLGLSVQPRVPAYFDRLIAGLRRGEGGRWVHLGHWDTPPSAQPGDFARAQARLDEVLLGMAELRDGQAILDVGCGFGATVDAVNRRYSGMRIAGVNVDARQLALCRSIEPCNGNVLDWREADACRLPFADESFERVMCIEAMFHFASRRAFFAEAARVLAPGGLLVATDILLRASARGALDASGEPVAAAIVPGFGPWPDLWGADADHRRLAADAGLRCDAAVDATDNTRPSHRYTTPKAPPARPDAPVRAALALRWLHERGHLQYLYLRFRKPI